MDIKIQKKLQDLFISYTKNLPAKIKSIETQWQEQLRHYDPIKLKDLHRDVHSICGSAGTYGYTDIGKAARRMEIHLKTLLDSNVFTLEQQAETNVFLEQLKSAVSVSLSEKLSAFSSASLIHTDNKLVYVVEQDIALMKELGEDLKHAGYHTQHVKSLDSLSDVMQVQTPIAIILDTFYLDDAGIAKVQEIQKNQSIPVQLFCIVPDDDLLPRILAIRAGCNAFFQKPVDLFHLTQTLNQKCSISGESWRILIVDDSEALAEYYSLILCEAGMITHSISNPMLLLKALEDFQPDLLLMDIYMPQCTGLELAAVLRQESRYTKIPIIFLSTEDDKRKQLTAMSLGGDDFLTKPVTAQHLVSAVRLRSKRAGVLNYFMTTDSLTGLLNHSSILKRLDIELNHAKQKKIPLSFVMIDIDHFKQINDTYGHPVGDTVIKKLATLLLVRLRSQDIVGRYGGEEFAIILPGATMAKSKEICDDLRKQFSQVSFRTGEHHFSVNFSAGIACLRVGGDAQTILDEADKALYKAKQLGRNQVVLFHAEF